MNWSTSLCVDEMSVDQIVFDQNMKNEARAIKLPPQLLLSVYNKLTCLSRMTDNSKLVQYLVERVETHKVYKSKLLDLSAL
jgi:hypothetical protein